MIWKIVTTVARCFPCCCGRGTCSERLGTVISVKHIMSWFSPQIHVHVLWAVLQSGCVHVYLLRHGTAYYLADTPQLCVYKIQLHISPLKGQIFISHILTYAYLEWVNIIMTHLSLLNTTNIRHGDLFVQAWI